MNNRPKLCVDLAKIGLYIDNYANHSRWLAQVQGELAWLNPNHAWTNAEKEAIRSSVGVRTSSAALCVAPCVRALVIVHGS